MTNRFFIICLWFWSCAVFSGAAYGQGCNPDYELIYELDDVRVGSYNVWDSVYGEVHLHESFKDGVFLPSGHTLAVGDSYVYEDGDVGLLVAEFDRRGRVIDENHLGPKGYKGTVGVLKPLAEGKPRYTVVGNVDRPGEDGAVWIGFLNDDRGVANEVLLRHDEGHLTVHDVIHDHAREAYVFVTSLEYTDKRLNDHAVIYTVSSDGRVLSEQAYLTGLENRVLDISLVEGGGYLAVGYIYGADGRKNGWAARLDQKKSIVWQRQYPRGRGAKLTAGDRFLDGYFVVGGEAAPTDQGNMASWLMLLDASNGQIGWQRYYRGHMHYRTKGLIASDDGLISLLVDGDPPGKKSGEQENDDYVRLLTLNPRGFVFIGDEYFNDAGSDAHALILGPAGERIIIGATKSVHQIEQGEGAEKIVETKRSLDGWVLAASATEPYKDPCVQPYSFLP